MTYDPSIHNDARPNVGVTVVPVAYDINRQSLQTIVYRRSVDAEQFAGKISLPNGVYDRQKISTSDEAATNALKDKLSLEIPHMEQLYTFTGNDIDPGRINTVNIAYFSILRKEHVIIHADPTFESEWVDIEELLAKPDSLFAFNHKEVLAMALSRVKSQAEYMPLALQLLPVNTTIPDFKKLTEILIGQELNNTRFRDRVKRSGLLIEMTGMMQSGNTRKSQVYQKNPDFTGDFYPRNFAKPAG